MDGKGSKLHLHYNERKTFLQIWDKCKLNLNWLFLEIKQFIHKHKQIKHELNNLKTHNKCHSFSFSYIESKQYYVTILNYVLFALLNIFALSLDCLLASQSYEILVFHNLGANKTLLKVSVNNTSSFWSSAVFSNCPASDLIFSWCEKVNQVQSIVSSSDYFREHWLSFFLFNI